MNSDDVNDRKQKLNNIIQKITVFQLLKLKAASNGGCNREINMNPQERDNEMNNEKGQSGFPGFKLEAVGPSAELPEDMPKL